MQVEAEQVPAGNFPREKRRYRAMKMSPQRASQIATVLLQAHSRQRSDIDVFDQFLGLDGGIPTLVEWMAVGKSINFETSPTFVSMCSALSLFERHGMKPRPRLTDAYIKRTVALAKAAVTSLE
jgi:hypothetical protein